MRNNARDIFKKMFGDRKTVLPKVTELPKQVEAFQPEKLSHEVPRGREWTNRQNQMRSGTAKAVAKRHKKNKVGRRQRKVNRAV